MWVEVFKTGTHTDSAGNTRVWAEKDLDTIVEKYNSVYPQHEAPVVIGHPKDNSPAYGWVEALERRGESLWAKIKPTVQEFVDWVKQGLYKKVSISLYPDLTLRHVGFLGAVPPAIKGLSPVQFSEGEYMELGIGDWGIEFETAENFKEVDRMEELIRQKDEEIARLKVELERLQKEKRRTEFMSFCEELEREGKITPSQKELVVDFMEILCGVGEYEFSDSKANSLERFKEFLKGLPKHVVLEEVAVKKKIGKPTKDFKEMSGWDLLELYKQSPQEFNELIEKNNRR